MAARQTYYAESLTEQTNTTTTYSSAVTLTFTPDASSSYLIIASANIGNATILTRDIKCRLRNNTSGTDLATVNQQMKDLTDRTPFFAIWVETFGSSPASQTYQIDWAVATAADSGRINEARLFAIKLGANDQWVVSDGNTTTTATTFTDKAVLTFTPASSGDYLIIGSAQGQSADGDEANVKFVTPSGDLANTVRASKGNASFVSWGTMVKQTLAASSQTFKFQLRNNRTAAGDLITLRTARIVALRLSDFDANYYAEQRASATTTTSASYQDRVTLTQTPAATEHVILFCGIVTSNNTSVSAMLQGAEGATVVGVNSTEDFNSNVDAEYPWLSVRRATLAASSTTWKVQYKSSTGTTAIIGITDAAVAVLQTGSSGAVTVAATGVSAAGAVGTATVAGIANVPATGVAAAAAVGTATAGVSITVAATGVAAGSAVGTASVAAKAGTTPTGVTAAGAVGTATVVGKGNVTATGVAAAGAVGTATVAAKANVPATGVTAAGAVGTATVAARAGVTATGVTAAGAVGTPAVSAKANATATGVAAAGAVGAVTVTAGGAVVVAAAGVAAAGAVGTVTISGKANLVALGVAAAGAIGDVTVDTGAAPTADRAKVWDGSAWTAKPAKVWSGSAWVEKPVKVWDGSAWI